MFHFVYIGLVMRDNINLKINNKKLILNSFTFNLTLSMLIPFVLFWIIALYYFIDSTEKKSIQHISRFNEDVALLIVNKKISIIKQLMLTMSNSINVDGIRSIVNDKNDNLNQFITNILDNTDYFKSIVISDNAGQFKIYPTSINIPGYDPRSRPWYPTAGASGELFISKSYNSLYKLQNESNNEKSLTFSMNIFDNGNKVGNIALDLNLQKINQELQQIVTPYKGNYQVVDMNGIIILNGATDNNLNEHVSPSIFNMIRTHDAGYFYDKDELIAYAKVKNTGWYVLSIVKTDEIWSQESDHRFIAIGFSLVYLFVYVLILIIYSAHFKQIIAMLHISSNGINVSDDYTDIESIYRNISDNYKKLQEERVLSVIDPLTLCGTRRKLKTDVDLLIASNVPFYLAIIDLDDFKNINDTYGHTIGDEVLKYICSAGRAILGDEYQLYRFGGEEIVAIFPNCSYEETNRIMNDWRHIVSQRTWREPMLSVSFSGGIALHDQNSTFEQTLNMADTSLYNAKKAGKNQIIG